MDCTCSMRPQLSAVTEQIRAIVDETLQSYPGWTVKVGFAGYFDHKSAGEYERNRLPFTLDFTTDVEGFKEAINTIVVQDGYDYAEDVLAGLEGAASHLNWNSKVRLLIHFGDAPPHGQIYLICTFCLPSVYMYLVR
ncbi:uncharacterized protein EV422DRAFT_31912 [Fimicolochytrium jonesii]|uniref:uncharacterized protein n=1 Tax=Fimicolochytrium jonesii TaxID=1396493 RepID=UPI0022FE0A81|nr:uncharacterized protein EV422DRAFT_31912 [Fimicolochytrium jonesii]KAI8827216.1 hypothetical protein EV422DRAFT_31912 [Fimicolochytrium jonesii]